MSQDIQKDLREAYRLYARADRNIKLPSAVGIDRTGDGLRLRLDAKSVTDNMQTDAAAFEAWALLLRLWLGEKRVPQIVLDWEAPPDGDSGHYQRFLYRVAQFGSLFPEWFSVVDPGRLATCRALTEPLPILNVASARESGSSASTASPEHELELELIGSEPFRRHFGLKADRVDRQFPVGLFGGTVSDRTRIFTGGKSAIDIVGVGEDNRLWIFELKAGNNISVGTLSELLLYTSVIREAAQEKPRIRFNNGESSSRVGPRDVQKCTGVSAVMLVENLHPLLEHPELLNALNQAAAAHWNFEPGAKPVCFLKALVSEFKKAAEANA